MGSSSESVFLGEFAPANRMFLFFAQKLQELTNQCDESMEGNSSCANEGQAGEGDKQL